VRLSSFLQSPTGVALRYACSVTLLGWMASRVDWHALGALQALDARYLLPAGLLAGLAYPLQAWRWHGLLHTLQVDLPARWVHVTTWIGQFYSAFLPGGVAGDAVRFGYLWRARPGHRAAGAASLLADRLLGLAALFGFAALALALHGRGAGELDGLLAASLAGAVLLLAGGWSLARTRWWQPLSARLLGTDRATALHEAALALGRRPGPLACAGALSAAVWLVDFGSLWLLARAVGLALDPVTLTVAAAAAYVAASLPISIGGHGVREGALVVTLGWLGYPAATTPGVPLLVAGFWALTVGWSAAGGLVYAASLVAGGLTRPAPPNEPPPAAGG
jgi:uncharacterized membrane protein YbhN (UPF0104 family)